MSKHTPGPWFMFPTPESSNQVAHAMAQENRAIVKAREDKELADKKAAEDAKTKETAPIQ